MQMRAKKKTAKRKRKKKTVKKISVREAYENGWVESEIVTVQKDDLGSKYFWLDSTDVIYNRGVDEERARQYVEKVGQGLAYTQVILVDQEDGTYKVVDGQHRIYGFSTRMKIRESISFDARIFPKNIDTEELLESLRKDKRHSPSDSLDIYRGRSNWPKGFKNSHLTMVTRGGLQAGGFRYPVVVGAAYNFQKCIEADALRAQKTEAKYTIETWVTTPLRTQKTPGSAVPTIGVLIYRDWLEWWFDNVDARLESNRRRAISGKRGLMMYFLFRYMYKSTYSLDPISDKEMDKIAERIVFMHEKQFAVLKSNATSSSIAQFASPLMKAINRGKRPHNLFEIYGIDGRNDPYAIP